MKTFKSNTQADNQFGTIVSLDHEQARAFTEAEYTDHLISGMDFSADQARDIIHRMKNTVNGDFFATE